MLAQHSMGPKATWQPLSFVVVPSPEVQTFFSSFSKAEKKYEK
jgi:hypothetical protein